MKRTVLLAGARTSRKRTAIYPRQPRLRAKGFRRGPLGCWIKAVVLAGRSFYTSGTFWAGAGTIAGVLGTIVTLWVTMRVPHPKRRLFYSMDVVGSYYWRADPYRKVNAILSEKKPKWPHVVDVRIASRGRFDIPREAFDGGEPIRLDVGAPIVECINVATSPSGRRDPVWTIKGSALLIGPCLIGKHETIVFSLLVDGLSPRLAKPAQSLTDVNFLPRDVLGGFYSRRGLAIWVSGLILAIVILLLFLLGTVHGVVKDTLKPVEWILVAVVLMFPMTGIAEWFSGSGWLRQRRKGD